VSGPSAVVPDVEISRYPIRNEERRHCGDSKQYYLSVPGMGGCTHPVTDVVSLNPAEAEAAVLGLLDTFPIADATRVAAEYLTRLPATLRGAPPDGDALIRAAVRVVRIAAGFPAPEQGRRLRKAMETAFGDAPVAASGGRPQ
jgi:hypothetical protein